MIFDDIFDDTVHLLAMEQLQITPLLAYDVIFLPSLRTKWSFLTTTLSKIKAPG